MEEMITGDQLKRRRLDRILATWARLFRVSRLLGKEAAEPMKKADLSGPQFYLLQLVGSENGMNQQKIADTLSVTKGNICQHLDKLENRGLIYRESEGRSNMVRLSNSGHLILGAIVPEHDTIVRDLFSKLTATEVKTLSSLLRKLS